MFTNQIFYITWKHHCASIKQASGIYVWLMSITINARAAVFSDTSDCNKATASTKADIAANVMLAVSMLGFVILLHFSSMYFTYPTS
jgi:hypothetical protein